MKVLHVMNGPNWGGSYRFVSQLCERQRSFGVDAWVCYLECGSAAQRVEALGAPVLSYNPSRKYPNKLARWADLEQGYERIVREFKPELINTHLSLSHVLTDRIRSRIAPHKWVALAHQSWRQFGYSHDVMKRPWLKYFMMMRHGLGDAWFTRKADRITTVSDAVRQDCIKVGMGRTRVTSILSGIVLNDPADMPDLRPLWGIPRTSRIIGTLGYFDPRKGFDLLLRAFMRISDRQPDVHVIIAGGDLSGDSEYRRRLLQLRSESRCPDRIHILGEQRSGAEFMFNVDICAIPSTEEAFSLVVVEAMQFGKPGVITSGGGCREVCRHEQEGLVFQSRNIADLARQLDRILTDRALAERLGRAARARAHTELTLDRCAQEHIRVYEEVLGQRAVRAMQGSVSG